MKRAIRYWAGLAGALVLAATPSKASDGPLAELGRTLADHGIYVGGRYVGAVFGNVDGGRESGALLTNELVYGFDLDLEHMAGIPGASFHFLADTRTAEESFSTLTGSTLYLPANSGPVATTRLTWLAWEQALLDGRVNLLAGRISAGADFATSELYCQFVSGVCSTLNPWGWSANSNANWWPLAAWGGRLAVRPTETTYVRTGIYGVDDTMYLDSGWPGGDMGLGDGAFIPLEVGYQTTFANDTHPRAFDLGLFWDDSQYTDARGRRQRGRMSIYGQAQQMVWRPDPGETRGLHVFAAAMGSVVGDGSSRVYGQAGAVGTGLIPTRPDDTMGALVLVNRFDDDYVDATNALIAAQGRQGTIPATEVVFELNYGLALAPGVTLQPFAQYIVNPDQRDNPTPDPGIDHALALGFQVTIGFNDLLGLPSLPRDRK